MISRMAGTAAIRVGLHAARSVTAPGLLKALAGVSVRGDAYAILEPCIMQATSHISSRMCASGRYATIVSSGVGLTTP